MTCLGRTGEALWVELQTISIPLDRGLERTEGAHPFLRPDCEYVTEARLEDKKQGRDVDGGFPKWITD